MRIWVLLLSGLILACSAEEDPQERTRVGWDALVESLQEARDGLDSTLAFPPEPTDRNMA